MGFYSPAVAEDHRDRVLPIMTRNLDEGTDFGPIFQATTPQDFAIQVAAAYLEVQASNIPERAAAIADEIAAQQPYLVGLQEVSVWSTGPLFMHADTETFNALRSLLTALAARGQQYTVIAILKGFTWPLHCEDPFTPFTTPDQRLDLVLFRNGHKGLDALTTDLIGDRPSDLTPSGLWPSDHAGLASVFRLEP